VRTTMIYTTSSTAAAVACRAPSTRSDAYPTSRCRISNRGPSPLLHSTPCRQKAFGLSPVHHQVPYRRTALRISITNPPPELLTRQAEPRLSYEASLQICRISNSPLAEPTCCLHDRGRHIDVDDGLT
jgi:hypothetical protein